MTIKKWTYAVGFTAGLALVACSGENGTDGAPGADGADGTSCIAKALKDSTGFDIICGDKTVGTIKDGDKGAKGDKGDKGEKGDKGATGNDGKDGASCSVKSFDGGFKVLCDGDSVGVLVNGIDGNAGKTAFELAVEAGFEGTEEEWIASLKGETGVAGKTAYELAVEAGFEGTEEEWRASLKGDKGDQGDVGDDGKSAYELAVEAGFEGTEAEWRASLKGDKGDQGDAGDDGKSAYELAVEAGFVGTEAEWRTSLKGDKGDTGDDGESCELEDNGDGTVTVTCSGASVTLMKAMCGVTPYDPATHFCQASNMTPYPFCDKSVAGGIYDGETQFCSHNKVETLCGGESYDTETHYCELDVVYDYCGTGASKTEYDHTTHYCENEVVYDYCVVGGKNTKFDHATHYCEDNNVYAYALCLEGGDVKYKPTSEYCYTTNASDEIQIGALESCGTGAGLRMYNPRLKFCRSKNVGANISANLANRSICGDEEAQADTLNIDIRYNTAADGYGFGQICDERDYHIYKFTTIGEQVWMAENLNYAYLEPTTTKDSSSFCYNNNPKECESRGRFYLWSAAIDSTALEVERTCGNGLNCDFTENVRGVCPEGWHLPSKAEITALVSYDGNTVTSISPKLKAKDTWATPGTDLYGFDYKNVGYWAGSGSSNNFSAIWSSDNNNYSYGYGLFIYSNDASTNANYTSKSYGLSVRCIKD